MMRRSFCDWFTGILLLAACSSVSPTTKPAATPAAPRDSDATTGIFFSALRDRDFATAEAQFDDRVKAALPAEKLAEVWNEHLRRLGSLASWSVVQRTDAQGKDIRSVRLRFERGELQSFLLVDPQTQQVAGLRFQPVFKPSTPALYVNPAAFGSEEISFGKEPFVLKGTLTLPKGEGPFPGVVLVHGSGPNDRDETVAANKPFKDLAEGLASRGIAVLRYDKRTFLYGAQLNNQISIDDEVVLDAVAAVNLLKGNPKIDARRVFVIGHSLGAQLAPEIGVRAKPVAGVVLLAPPGRPPWDLVLAQLRYLHTPADKLAEVEKAVALLKAGKLGSGKLLEVPASYWQDWASRDGVAMAKRLGTPILILRGERDFQVTEEDLLTWQKGLTGVPNVEVLTIPGANHLFIHGTGKSEPTEYEVPGHVDQSVIDKISSLIAPVPS